MNRRHFMALTSAAAATTAWAEEIKKVLFLGDEVMLTYKPDLLKLIGDKAQCSFALFPKTGKPDWEAFCNTQVYGKGYDVIHFSYGRELMFHENGKPRAKTERRGEFIPV
ncbi:hypothetical protein EGM51_03860 [Verrucomicrobia bacterium S94]|nr:hypothetical protein EGM51_03860 [Verrucomicrobia bacterium S94]